MLLDGQIVVGAKNLHTHHGEDEDDDGQYEAEIAESAHRPTDDSDEQVQRRPRLGQLEDSQLQRHTPATQGHRHGSHNTPDE